MLLKRSAVVLLAIFTFIILSAQVFAISEEEKTFLSMYFTDEELQVVSTTRSLKSITRVAENVEVVTKEDIELMNAHTLADVLNTINGVQVNFFGAAPGSQTTIQIQGSRIEHVILMVDGVRTNDISGGIPDPSLIPVQIIEKVEVIKGPASSVWGSSLGGVINVITKAGEGDVKGMLSGDYGQRNTGDFRGELSGKKDAFSYYLFAGRLQSDGFRTHDDNSRNSVYTRLSYDFSTETSAQFTLLYTKARNAVGDFEDIGVPLRIDTKDSLLLSTLSVKSRLSDSVSIEFSGRTEYKWSDFSINDLSAGVETLGNEDDRKYGGSGKLEFRRGIHNVVFGADYDFLSTSGEFVPAAVDENIAAVYINDTISLGKLSIIPGLRFDSVDVKDTSLKTNFFSPSLGLTYEIGEKTLLRGIVARGFNIPPVSELVSPDVLFFRANPDLTLEKVWSYQIGAETGALKYLWVKVAGFWHNVSDAITEEDFPDGSWTLVNKARARRLGVEAELKTMAFYNFTLHAAASYVRTKDLDTGEILKDNPQYTYDVGLEYNDKKSFRALLHGHYIWWSASSDFAANYNAFIFDLNAIKTLYKGPTFKTEAFFTVHNLFDGSQYFSSVYKNARRWIEGGIRVAL